MLAAQAPVNHFEDDAQLRYKSLIEHVERIENGITGFPGAIALKSLAMHFDKMATTLFEHFSAALEKDTDPQLKLTSKHKMVDKLIREWEFIYQLIANAKLLGSHLNTTDEFSWLNAILGVAQNDLNYAKREFIIVPKITQRYALTHFRYATEFAALDVPVSSLNAPWEWSVLWHELAGRKIHDILKADAHALEIPIVAEQQGPGHESARDLIEGLIGKLHNDLPVGYPFLKTIREMLKLPLQPKWSQDWETELFEDACSVLTFGPDFLPVLESILNRSTTLVDDRHPYAAIRLNMARRLLDTSFKLENDEQEEKIEAEVAKRILELIEKYDLKLPVLCPEQHTEIHAKLGDFMKQFASGQINPMDIESFRTQLIDTLPARMNADKRNLLQPPDEDISQWPEVASQDYKQMLSLRFSDSDLLAAEAHSSADHQVQGFANWLTVYYYDANSVLHYHTHSY